MSKHLPYIDAAKGIAILGVVAVHVGQVVSTPVWFSRLAAAGKFGVQIFFLTSGFTIFLSLSNRMPGNGSINAWAQFFLRRFSRIAPLAYLAMLMNIFINHPVAKFRGVAVTMVFITAGLLHG